LTTGSIVYLNLPEKRLFSENASKASARRQAICLSSWRAASAHFAGALAAIAGFSRQTLCHQLQLVGSIRHSRFQKPALARLPRQFTGCPKFFEKPGLSRLLADGSASVTTG